MTSKRRTISITIAVAVITIIAALSITLDWSTVITGKQIDIDFYNPARLLKRLISLCSFCIVIITGLAAFMRRDHLLLLGIFTLILIGDFLLLFNQDTPGIILFIVVQLLLIVRHAAGINALFKKKKIVRETVYMLATIAVSVIIGTLMFCNFYSAITPGSSKIYVILVYLIMITLSLCIAFQTKLTGYFPVINYRLIITGMVCFYLCDITVGVRLVYSNEDIRTIATALTWIFYTPALTLLALSGFGFKTRN